jgi:hypothetical protein
MNKCDWRNFKAWLWLKTIGRIRTRQIQKLSKEIKRLEKEIGINQPPES